MVLAQSRENASANWDIKANYAINVFDILAACMEHVNVHSNATVKKDGVDYFAIKVSLLNVLIPEGYWIEA